MQFLDAKLVPIRPKTGAFAIAIALAVMGCVAALNAATGIDPRRAFLLAPGLILGTLLAASGVSIMRSPKAFATLLVVFGVLILLVPDMWELFSA